MSNRLRYAECFLLLSALLLAGTDRSALALGPDLTEPADTAANVVDNHLVDVNHFAGTLEQSGLRESFYAMEESPRKPKRRGGPAETAQSEVAAPTKAATPIELIDSLSKAPAPATAISAQSADLPTPPSSKTEQSVNSLSALEEKLFDRAFSQDSQNDRLERLEKSVFGDARSGDVALRTSALIKSIDDSAKNLTVTNRFKVPNSVDSHPKTFQQAMEEGTANYNAARFHAAEESFEIAACFKPADSRVHYCLGRTLAKLGDMEGAHREFKICFRLDPFGPLGTASKAAMLDSGSAAASAAAAPIDKPVIIQKAIATIRYQAHDAATARINQGQAIADGRMQLGAQWVQQIADRVQQELYGLNGGDYNPNQGYGRRRGYYRDPQQVQEVSNWRAIATSYARTDTAVQASKASRDGIERATSIHDCANNLVRLIGDTPGPGRPKLRAYGTCLYVRYYGAENPDDAPPPEDPVQALHAIAKKATADRFKTNY